MNQLEFGASDYEFTNFKNDDQKDSNKIDIDD